MTGPMSPLEERLTAALDARAHQIHESDLRPAEVPGPSSTRRGVRAGWMAAAAAGIVAVIAVPYAVAQLSGSDAPHQPTPGASTSPEPNWQLIAMDMIDVDGDGFADPVRIRQAPDGHSANLEVQLDSGTLAVLLPDATSYSLEPGADIDRSGGTEVLVSVGTALEVYGLDDDSLVHLTPAEDSPPLMHRTDKQGRPVSWFVDGSRLYTVRSVDPKPGSEEYPVDRWRWNVSGTSLVAEQVKSGCVRAADPTRLVPCATDVPTEFVWGENSYTPTDGTVELNFLVEGKKATAGLTPFDNGDSQLSLTAGGKTWRAAVFMGAGTRIVGEGIRVSPTGDRAVLVSRQYAVGSPPTEDFAVFGWVNGDLVNLAPGSGTVFPTTTRGVANPENQRIQTWVQDGWLYTGVETFNPGQWQVYRWQQNGSRLEQVPLDGTYCFSETTKTGRLCS